MQLSNECFRKGSQRNTSLLIVQYSSSHAYMHDGKKYNRIEFALF